VSTDIAPPALAPLGRPEHMNIAARQRGPSVSLGTTDQGSPPRPAPRAEVATECTTGIQEPAQVLVYVGMTGLDPDLRFDRHKAGIQANRFVFEYGLRLVPAL
jgi:hypothetical protein